MTKGTLHHPPEEYDAQIIRTIPYYEEFIMETINLLRSMDRQPRLWLDTGCGTGKIVAVALDSRSDSVRVS